MYLHGSEVTTCWIVVHIGYIYQELLVHVTYDTSLYSTKWFVTSLCFILNVTVTWWIYSLLFPSVQTTLPNSSVSGSGRTHTKLYSHLKLDLLASLNEFSSYEKPVLSKGQYSYVLCCFSVRVRASQLSTKKGSPWQQTRPISCRSAIADTSFHIRFSKLLITLQNAPMHSHIICLLLQLCAAFQHMWCASRHSTYITYIQ